jgi:type VII secretion protein EccB
MQTQRDHVHAHQFMVGRLTAALVIGDPSTAEPPARRVWFGVLCGIIAAVLIAVAFWVYGLISPGGNTSWMKSGAVVVEKESGTQFVYSNGQLRPVTNRTSAMLITGGPVTPQLVSRTSLADARRGAPIGIVGAPLWMPSAPAMARGSWLSCAPVRTAGASPSVSINVNPTVRVQPVADDQYVLVGGADGSRYLILRSAKYPVANASVLAALGMANVQPALATSAWLDALPTQQALAAARIDGAGQPVQIGATTYPVGQLFKQTAANGEDQLFVLRPDGLAPLSRTEFQLLAATPIGGPPVDIDVATLVAAPRSPDRSLTDRLPDLAAYRRLDGGNRVLCLALKLGGDKVAAKVVFTEARNAPLRDGAAASISIPNGSGVVAAALPLTAGNRSPERYFISDQGIRYALPDDDAVKALGLSGVNPIALATSELELLPAGPALSRAEAATEPKG